MNINFERVSKVKNKIYKFIDNNIDHRIHFNNLERFLVKYYVIASTSFHNYQKGRVSVRRQRVIRLMRLFSLMTAIRYLSSALVDTEFVSIILMADPHYLLGHKRLNSFMLSTAIIIANLSLGGVHYVLESKGQLTVISFFYKIAQNKSQTYRLNRYNYRKFCLKKNLLTKYALNSAMFLPMIAINIIYFYGLTAIAYFDSSKNFSLISIIFWNFCQLIWLIDLFGIAMGGFAYYYISTLFLKYQFRQLDEQIRQLVTNRDITGLWYAIRYHNQLSVSTHHLNITFKFLLFILYFFAKVPLNGLLYISNAPDTHISARIIMAILLLVCFGILLNVSLMSALVSKWAHNCRPVISGLMTTELPLRFRLKLMDFIERLSGHWIGFYCYDMFAINNYVFFGYIMSWISNYFLIIQLINDIKVK